MTEEDIEIVPLIYAISKGMKAYREAAAEYKKLSEENINSDESEMDLEYLVKRYREFKLLFSLAKKLLG
jgi:hypothetical protein